VRAGVTKIRLTGGEPTLRRDLLPLTAGLAALPGLSTLAITSNGITLPRQLPALRAAGLSALNISLDTLRPERFEAMTRRPAEGHAKVMSAIDTALRLGYDPVKVSRCACVCVYGQAVGGVGEGVGGWWVCLWVWCVSGH
jgi:cyclic pyranopterin phosphate synthase